MNLSVGLTTSASIEKMKSVADRADSLGLYGVWLGEDIGRPQEIFTATSLILLRTRKAKVGIGVASPLIRNVTTIARAATALSEISPDRFRLGLGIGGIQDLASMGIRIEKPVDLMRKTITTLRAIWENQGQSIDDEELRLSSYRPRFNGSGDIPIFIGARGPKLLALAAVIADGVILSGPRRYVQESIKMIKEKRVSSKLNKSNFSFVLWVPTAVLRDSSDLGLVKQTVAVVAVDTPDTVLRQADVSRDEVELVRSAISRYGLKEAAKSVSDNLVGQFCMSGDAESICETFRGYSSLGVDEVVFGPPYGIDSQHAISEVAKAWRRA